jgi:hypothetical protein
VTGRIPITASVVVLALLPTPGCQTGTEAGRPAADPAAPAAGRPAGAGGLPAELDALNTASRALYAGARARELATVPAVIIVSGDDLVLRRNGGRTVATVVPAEYHALKSVAHTTLALFGHLADVADRPLGEDRVKGLRDYRAVLAAAGPPLEALGLDAQTLARQKRILARAEQFAARVLRDGRVSAADLAGFCRQSRPDVLANGAAAARAQLRATHRQVMAWKEGMTAEEWGGLTVIVSGGRAARAENAAVQYFSRLLGGTGGEGRRVVYAESVADEDRALAVVGTLRLDGRLAEGVFGDRSRLDRDFLADAARAAIDDILAPE